MLDYIKLHANALKAYKRLSDTEFGRAVRAVLQYLEDGTEASLPGKESIMYDVLREQLEQDAAEYERKCSIQRENGRKGGRPRVKPTESEKTHGFLKNPTKPNETQKTHIYIDDDDNIARTQEEHNELFTAAERAGFPVTGATMDALVDLYASHGKQAVLDGIKSCVDHSVLTLAYLRACLAPKPKREGKCEADPTGGFGWL